MNGREFWALRDVSNDELEAGLAGLLGAGARVEARIIAHLAEVETRRLHLLAGCSSLYDYCHKRLGLSDYEAFTRIAAARVARSYPLVFEMLERRELHLTAVCEVRDFLTPENHRELLADVSGRTKLQVREVLARWFPLADVPPSLRKLPSLEPLAPGKYRLLLTLNADQKQKLELARDLLSHANAAGDFATVVERALDELISRIEKRRFGRADAPTVANERQPGRAQNVTLEKEDSGARRRKHIPRETRRTLVARDGLRCAFVSEQGIRCDALTFLQFHHRHAWAQGGGDTADNLELLCQGHNRLRAEQDFGRDRIDGVITGRRALRSGRHGSGIK